MLFWALNIFFIAAIIFLLLALSAFWPPDCPWAPWWVTPKHVAREICQDAHITKKDVVYDLGSGTAQELVVMAGEYQAKCIGVEIDPLRVWISKIRLAKFKNVTIYKKNLFAVPLAPATVVFFYLVPRAIKRLKKKFLSELRPGTRIISFRYPIPVKLYDNKVKLLVANTKHVGDEYYVYELLARPSKAKQ